MKKLSIKLLLPIFAMFTASTALAQDNIEDRFSTYSKLLSPEKLYLHTDRDFYCAGDTLWFKAYLQNTSVYSEFPESNFAYVELIGFQYEKDVYTGKVLETKRLVERIKAKRRDGVIQGYIPI